MTAEMEQTIVHSIAERWLQVRNIFAGKSGAAGRQSTPETFSIEPPVDTFESICAPHEIDPIYDFCDTIRHTIDTTSPDEAIGSMRTASALLEEAVQDNSKHLKESQRDTLVEFVSFLDRKWDFNHYQVHDPEKHIQYLTGRFKLINSILDQIGDRDISRTRYHHTIRQWREEKKSLEQPDFLYELLYNPAYLYEKQKNGLNYGEWLRAALLVGELFENTQNWPESTNKETITVEYKGKSHRMNVQTARKMIRDVYRGRRIDGSRFGYTPKKTYEQVHDTYWNTIIDLNEKHVKIVPGTSEPDYETVRKKTEAERNTFIMQVEQKLIRATGDRYAKMNLLIRVMTRGIFIGAFDTYVQKISELPERHSFSQHDQQTQRTSDMMAGVLFERVKDQDNRQGEVFIAGHSDAQYDTKGIADFDYDIDRIRSAWADGAITRIVVLTGNGCIQRVIFEYVNARMRLSNRFLHAGIFVRLFGLQYESSAEGITHISIGPHTIDAGSDEDTIASGFSCLRSDSIPLQHTVRYSNAS